MPCGDQGFQWFQCYEVVELKFELLKGEMIPRKIFLEKEKE